ncbi:MAG: YceI family protein [Woeseiaceae bacterium]
MKRFMRNILLLLVTVILPVSLQAEPVRYTADKWHTRVYFSVSHMGLSNYGGRFIEQDISFVFDEDNLENSRVEVTIPVSSIDTYSPELNSKMGSDGFFDAENYPMMHFISREIVRTTESRAKMTGELTIRGVTRPITFDVIYNNKVMHPFFKLNNVGFSATAKLDSRAYGVNSLPDWMVDSTVDIRIEMEAFEGEQVPYYADDN